MKTRTNALGLLSAVLCIALAGAPATAFDVGPLSIGGAMRVNYIYGDYETSGEGPSRGGDGGNFELDTYRINLDLTYALLVGKAEYRWYDGYNFLHTGWLGADLGERGMVEVGLTRVPFGVGPYGPAHSWFFDQHYYVGLSDDMDLGIKYTKVVGSWMFDLAYFLGAEWNGQGATDDSARYSYDIVDTGMPYGHYKEASQVNVRTRVKLEDIPLPSEVGVSLQYGLLDADEDRADDTYAAAGSVHSRTTLGNWALMLQVTHYRYAADYEADARDAMGNPLSDDLITLGAYDFAWPVASEGTIPAVALSYRWEPGVEWIDSMTFYNDYSIILKDGESGAGTELNDSALNVTGVAIASGGWYIYVDYAYSDGNYFVGNEGDDYSTIEGVGDFGVNGNNDWNGRFNINIGYYF